MPMELFASWSATWREYEDATRDDGRCLRSGEIPTNGLSRLFAFVSGAGRLSFDWKISAARGDYCRFYADGVETNSIQRSTGWKSAEISLGPGQHLLEWVFEEDANANLPKEVVYDNWKQDVTLWFKYLSDNAAFALNVYNSSSRLYMLRYIRGRLRDCIRSFSEIVAEDRTIDRQDFEFIVEFYSHIVVGLIAQWMDQGMQLPREITTERVLRVLDNSIENIMLRFQKN
jgi:hypothetical protein